MKKLIIKEYDDLNIDEKLWLFENGYVGNKVYGFPITEPCGVEECNEFIEHGVIIVDDAISQQTIEESKMFDDELPF